MFGANANFLVGFSQRCRNDIRIRFLQSAAGKGNLPGVVLEFLRAQRKQQRESVFAVEVRVQDSRGPERPGHGRKPGVGPRHRAERL